MRPDNWTLCYQGIQRLYRNCVVNLMRTQLKKAFPTDWQVKLKTPFQKEWDDIIESAQRSRISGELDTRIIDEFDYIGVNHFFNLFDSYFDELFPVTPDISKKQRSQFKSAILGWVKTVKNLRDPLSHPPEEGLSLWDAIAILDAARRIVIHIDSTIALKIQDIESELVNADSGETRKKLPLDDSLPPAETIVFKFIGRQKEFKELWEWFESPRTRKWILHGAGGKGKSAIAYQFALQVKYKAPEPFVAVWWLSAKKRRFVEGTVVGIEQPDFSNINAALDKLLLNYGWADYTIKSLEEKQKELLRLFNELPALVVVDDIDTLEGQDEAAIEFFNDHAANTKSKILFTSRRRLFGYGASSTEVKGFSSEEGYEFIKSRLQLFGLDTGPLNKLTMDNILSVTEASPLYIEDLLRLCITGKPVQEVIGIWRQKGGDDAREYSLGREFEMLSHEGQAVILACSVWGQPCSYTDIRALTALSEDKTDKAVGELQKLFLVPKPILVDGLPQFDVNINVKSLVVKVMGQTELYRKVQASKKALAGELPKLKGRSLEISAAVRQVVSLVKIDHHPEAEQLLKQMLQKYVEDPDLTGQLGWLYKQWKPVPRIVDAREKFSRAAQLLCRRFDLYWHWWALECDQQEWAAAANAGHLGLSIFPGNWRLTYCEGYAKSRLGRELRLSFVLMRAFDEHQAAQNLLEKALVPLEDLAETEYNLHSSVLKAIVLNLEGLIYTVQDLQGITATERGAQQDINRYISHLSNFLAEWAKEHPSDQSMVYERSRLLGKFNLNI